MHCIFNQLPSHQLAVTSHQQIMYGSRGSDVPCQSTWNSLPKHLHVPPTAPLLLANYLKLSSSQGNNVYSALDALSMTCNINLRFALHYMSCMP